MFYLLDLDIDSTLQIVINMNILINYQCPPGLYSLYEGPIMLGQEDTLPVLYGHSAGAVVQR